MDDSVTQAYACRTRFALKQPELDVVDATTEDSKNVVCPGCRQPVIWREANGRHFFEHIGQSCSQAIECELLIRTSQLFTRYHSLALPITLYTPAPRDVFEIESPSQLIFDVKQGDKPFIRVRTQGQEVMLVIAINQYCQGSQLRAFQQRFDNLVEWDLSAMSIPASELDKALSSLILEPSDGASAPTAYWLSLSRAWSVGQAIELTSISAYEEKENTLLRQIENAEGRLEGLNSNIAEADYRHQKLCRAQSLESLEETHQKLNQQYTLLFDKHQQLLSEHDIVLEAIEVKHLNSELQALRECYRKGRKLTQQLVAENEARKSALNNNLYDISFELTDKQRDLDAIEERMQVLLTKEEQIISSYRRVKWIDNFLQRLGVTGGDFEAAATAVNNALDSLNFFEDQLSRKRDKIEQLEVEHAKRQNDIQNQKIIFEQYKKKTFEASRELARIEQHIRELSE